MNSNDIDKSYSGENLTPYQQKNIIDEVMKLEQQLKDPNVKSFRKTIYWNQPNAMENNNVQDKLLIDIVDYLSRIESKLEDIKIILGK